MSERVRIERAHSDVFIVQLRLGTVWYVIETAHEAGARKTAGRISSALSEVRREAIEAAAKVADEHPHGDCDVAAAIRALGEQ